MTWRMGFRMTKFIGFYSDRGRDASQNRMPHPGGLSKISELATQVSPYRRVQAVHFDLGVRL